MLHNVTGGDVMTEEELAKIDANLARSDADGPEDASRQSCRELLAEVRRLRALIPADPVDPDEAGRLMRKIFAEDDPEQNHARADALLVRIALIHGYVEAARAFEAGTKWYA